MFDLLLHGDRVELALPGARISTPLIACLAPETGLHVAVFAVAAEEHRPTSLDLLSLAVDRGGGAPDPDDASALADAAFDPRSWLAATAAELSGTEP
jgi:hypothetical protein